MGEVEENRERITISGAKWQKNIEGKRKFQHSMIPKFQYNFDFSCAQHTNTTYLPEKLETYL